MIYSAEEFVELRDGDDPRATHDEATKVVWLEVIDRYPQYRTWVVYNKSVPVDILRHLMSDPDADVRFAIAMKRKCPIDVLMRLAVDEDESVRARVAWNPKTIPVILEKLKDDPCEEVAEVAIKRLTQI